MKPRTRRFLRTAMNVRGWRSRFDRLVQNHIFPQRPFITFGPGAVMENVTIREQDGGIVIDNVGDTDVQRVHVYDGSFRFRDSVGGRVAYCHIVRRRRSAVSLVSVPKAPEFIIRKAEQS